MAFSAKTSVKSVNSRQRAAMSASVSMVAAPIGFCKQLLTFQSVSLYLPTQMKVGQLITDRRRLMTENERKLAETVFERNERREAEINDAMKQEHARREAAVKNMYRLRALRLARNVKSNNDAQTP
jgi:hypothetical protein